MIRITQHKLPAQVSLKYGIAMNKNLMIKLFEKLKKVKIAQIKNLLSIIKLRTFRL